MTQYIEKESAKRAIAAGNVHKGIIDAMQSLIDDIPAADVQEVRYGRWCCVETGYATCDNCNRSIYVGGDVRSETLDRIENEMFEFCPYCGAKMRTKEEQKIADL